MDRRLTPAIGIGNPLIQSVIFSFVLIGLHMGYDRRMMVETPARIEPLFFAEAVPTKIADLVVDVQAEASCLGRDLHKDSAAVLADLVRVMNC